MTGTCAACNRQVVLRGVTAAGRICSACVARASCGTCATCGRDGIFNGRNPAGDHWCRSCSSKALAARQAEAHRLSILAVVRLVEPQLSADTVRDAIAAAIGQRTPAGLAEHLSTDPGALSAGPNTQPPVLGRFVRALAAAGALRITPIHPDCLDCGRSQPVALKLGDAGICAACSSRRRGKPKCLQCGVAARTHDHDHAGQPRCASCARVARNTVERAALMTQLLPQVLAQTGIAPDLAREAIESVAPRRNDLRVLLGQLAGCALGQPDAPTRLIQLASALTARGADLPEPVCANCGQTVPTGTDLTNGRMLCHTCSADCPSCHRQSRLRGERICRRCRADRLRTRGTCTDCAKPDKVLDEQLRCRWCRQRCARVCPDCGKTGQEQTIAAGGVHTCRPCALARDLDRILPEEPQGPLSPLRAPILAAEPATTRKWLNRPDISSLLTDLATGTLPLTHQSLDAQPPSRSIELLRHLLCACTALPVEPQRPVDNLCTEVDYLVADLEHTNARTVRSWVHWRVLPRLRNQLGSNIDMLATARNAKHDIRQIISFIRTLESAGETLATCRQADIDRWFEDPRPAPRHVRPFLNWAQQTKRLPALIVLPNAPRGTLKTVECHTQRAQICQQLIQDSALDPGDRVAGALVVLYAQPLVRICALTTQDVHATDAGVVTLKLGTSTLEVHEPFATLILQLPQRRREGVAEQLQGPWLFPGQRAGQPIQPPHMGNRLRAIGIEPRTMRLTALAQLSRDVPPALLAGALGLNAAHVVRHSTRAGADWARYAADRQD